MKIEKVYPGQVIQLGRRGENLARKIEFDLSDWQRTYSDGVAQLLFQRFGDNRPYIREIEVEGSRAYWPITSWETEIDRAGKVELRWYHNDVLVKSRTWNTVITGALETPDAAVPEQPEQGWFEKVMQSAANIREAVDVAQGSAEDAAKSAAEAEASYEKTKATADSVQGIEDKLVGYVASADASKVSASKSAKDAADSAKVSADSATVAQSARDEAESFSSHPPVIGVTGNWMEWNGDAYADTGKPARGEKGDKGERGETGPEGYTPVRGTDYWTSSDIAEIQEYVDGKISAIPTPDVSGQIDAHNTDTAAHADIREAITQSAPVIVELELDAATNGWFISNGHTYESIKEIAATGTLVRVRSHNTDGSDWWYDCLYISAGNSTHYFTGVASNTSYQVLIDKNSNVTRNSYPLAYAARTINGKALTSDITLTAADVGAATAADIEAAIGNAIGGSY